LQNLLILLFLSISFFFLILNIIGKLRKREIEQIKSIIKKIRLNEYIKPDEIVLSKHLKDLEEEIKAMFLRTVNDISSLKKLEQIRTEFLGNVSHELRTPIFAIQGYIETLLDGALDDPKVNKSFLLKANQHTINLNNLLNDLIDISMIESGQMKMSLRYFNIHDFLEQIINELKQQAQLKGIELVLNSNNRNLLVFGDKERLNQVMTNLIINSIKYTEMGKVEVGIIEEEKRARIYVNDTGIGIEEKDLERIFERFYRVDKNRSRDIGGTGLGLAIVKHIIEAHDSKVNVISSIGKGSEFSFYLKK